MDRPGFRLGHRSVKLSIPCLERCYAENGVEMRVINDLAGGRVFDGLDWETLRILSTKDLRKLEEKEK